MTAATEYLTLNSVDLNDPDVAWIENLAPLRATADRRGVVEAMPYTPGGIVYPHRNSTTELVLVLFVTGSTWAELDDNEAMIRTDIVGDGDTTLTVPADWHRNNGEVWIADVLVRGIYEPVLDSDGPPIMRYNLPLRVKQGQFEPSGS